MTTTPPPPPMCDEPYQADMNFRCKRRVGHQGAHRCGAVTWEPFIEPEPKPEPEPDPKPDIVIELRFFETEDVATRLSWQVMKGQTKIHHKLVAVKGLLSAFVQEAIEGGLSQSNFVREVSSLAVLFDCSLQNHMGIVKGQGSPG